MTMVTFRTCLVDRNRIGREKYGQRENRENCLVCLGFLKQRDLKWHFYGNKIFVFNRNEKFIWSIDFWFSQEGKEIFIF